MKTVETFVHDDEKRKNIPTAEMESIVGDEWGLEIFSLASGI